MAMSTASKHHSGPKGPSNILSGFALGAGAAAAGVGVGAAALVAAPIVGAKEGGLLGGVAGLGAGVAGFAGGVLAGAVGATASVVAGAVNTPGSVVAVINDDDLHGVETIDLSKVALEDEDKYRKRTSQVKEAFDADMAEKSSKEYTPTTKVKDRSLYDALGVAPDATPSALKKAYYRLAMKEHPDKGGDTERFQKVGEAWQVLSDPARRQKYDERGIEALEDAKMADPGVVFAMMFGEDKFSHLFGDLSLVMTMRLDDGLDTRHRAEKLEMLQMEREVRLAKLLATRLDVFLSDPATFAATATEEARALKTVNLGPQMLAAIGTMYELRGSRGIFADAAMMAHTVETHVGALEGAVNLQKLQGKNDGGDPSVMQANLFKMMAMDIENTVGRAALLCLHDVSVPKEVRRKRADGLVILGKIFQGEAPAAAASAPAV